MFFLFQPVTEVNFPAVTFCNPYGHDTGEYVRAVFNNFEFPEDDWELIESEVVEPLMDWAG